jgi:hypothetical protein
MILCTNCFVKSISIWRPILKKIVGKTSKEFWILNVKTSNDWLNKFKAQYNISFKVVCDESKLVDLETVDE